MIGFGPTLFSRKHGETEYGVKAFLLGGYCRILGMYGPGDPDQFGYKLDGKKLSVRQARALDAEQAEDLVPTWSQEARDASLSEIPLSQRQRAFYNLPVSRRLVVMFGGPVMNLFLSFAKHGAGHLWANHVANVLSNRGGSLKTSGSSLGRGGCGIYRHSAR